jgi:predicted NBD/HSP70 family sugar kinase
MEKLQVGIDIGGTKMFFLAKTAEGDKTRKIDTGANFSGEDADRAISSFLEELTAPPSSIGIAIPGLVNDETGEVVYCDVLPKLDGWLPLVKKESVCPVRILNDADGALIEAKHEVGSAKNLVLIVIGTAVGASFWIDNQFLRGSQGWAGELGSIPIKTGDGVITLDQLAGGSFLLKRLGMDAQQLATLVEQGDAGALAAITQAGQALGLGIATVINIFNPEVVVLAGGTLRWTGYVEAALSSAKENSVPVLWAGCRVHISSHGGTLVAQGVMRAAAELAQK